MVGYLGGRVGCSLPHPAPQADRPPGSQRLPAGPAGAGCSGFGAKRRSGTAPTPAALPAEGEDAPPALAASPRRVSAGRARPLHPALPVRALRS